MRNGSKACCFCGSRFTFEEFELVDSMPAEQPCGGCVTLYAILGRSAQRKAEMRATVSDTSEPVDLSSQSAILARLLGNRRRASEEFDHAKAAAGDRD